MRLLVRLRLVLFFLFISSVNSIAQSETELQIIFEKIKKFKVEEDMVVSIGFIDGEKTQAFTFDKNGIDSGSTKIFEIGAFSQVFTTYLIMEQVLKGNLDLNENLWNYFEEDALKKKAPITIYDLCIHAGGLPKRPFNITSKDLKDPYKGYNKSALLKFFDMYPYQDYSKTYRNSHVGYGLLALLLEEIMQQPFNLIVNKHLSKQLGFKCVGLEDKIYEEQSIMSGAVGIQACMEDLLSFIRLALSNEDSILNTIAIPKSRTIVEGLDVALGWHVTKDRNHDWSLTMQNGLSPKGSCFISYVEETDKGVIILTNKRKSVDELAIDIVTLMHRPLMTNKKKNKRKKEKKKRRDKN